MSVMDLMSFDGWAMEKEVVDVEKTTQYIVR
jgi:hypothetical protein